MVYEEEEEWQMRSTNKCVGNVQRSAYLGSDSGHRRGLINLHKRRMDNEVQEVCVKCTGRHGNCTEVASYQDDEGTESGFGGGTEVRV